MGINRKDKYILHLYHIMPVDKFVHFSVDKERSENLKRRVNSAEGLFIDEEGNLNAQNNRIKKGSKPLDNNDLATKQYTDKILGKLGEDLRKIITQNVNRRLTKISSLENKIELNNKRADSADQIYAKIMEKIKTFEDYIFKYVIKPISLPKKTTIELEGVASQTIRSI